MGNCAGSKLSRDADVADADVVALCRNRKRLLKATIEHYHALAEAHASYMLSLNSVAAALNLFIAAADCPSYHVSSPNTEVPGSHVSSPPPSPPLSPMRLDVDDGYFSEASSSPARVLGSPLHAVPDAEGLWTSSEDYIRAVRDQEGIPELEEEENGKGSRGAVNVAEMVEEVVCLAGMETPVSSRVTVNAAEEVEEVYCLAGMETPESSRGVVNAADHMVEEVYCLAGTETPARERELFEALRDVGEQFIRASEAGKDLSSGVLCNPGFPDIKDNSLKLVRAITWSRSSSSLSSSSLYRSGLASSSRKSLFIESGSDVFDNCGGMASGSHSQTLGRLYVWEKKLYDEVKAGDDIQHACEKKCSQLRNQEAKGADSRSVAKNRMIARDLHTRSCVALQSIETISKRIEQLRDEELPPQLIELLKGLMKTWKIMLESHETQKKIMFEVATFSCPTQGRLCCDSQRSLTLQLETELRNWRTCFMSYIKAQRAYVEALDGWLSKSYIPDTEYISVPSHRVGVPPLLGMCHDWINSYRKLPDKTVSYAMKGFIKDMRYLWVRQGKEQQQKRRVDCLEKKLDLRINALQKTENRVLETKLSELKSEPVMHRRAEDLAGRKDLIDILRRKLHKEREKHQYCIQETARATMNGFKMSLTKVFESLSEFSKDSVKLYDELHMQNKEVKMA